MGLLKKSNMIFRNEGGWGVKGRLEHFRKFIPVGGTNRRSPLTLFPLVLRLVLNVKLSVWTDIRCTLAWTFQIPWTQIQRRWLIRSWPWTTCCREASWEPGKMRPLSCPCLPSTPIKRGNQKVKKKKQWKLFPPLLPCSLYLHLSRSLAISREWTQMSKLQNNTRQGCKSCTCGKKMRGAEKRRSRAAMMGKPIHQAPTHRGSFSLKSTWVEQSNIKQE